MNKMSREEIVSLLIYYISGNYKNIIKRQDTIIINNNCPFVVICCLCCLTKVCLSFGLVGEQSSITIYVLIVK